MAVERLISVIIPAYNAEDTIALAIDGILAQDHQGRVEIIVVDDGSTDKTADIVRACSGVRYVVQENAGPASARNHGAREAKGDIFFFTDADCRAQPDWISRMLQIFADQKVSVVSGSYGIANPSSALARIIHGEIVYRHKTLMPANPRFFGSYNFAVRRVVFEGAGGFNAGYRHASGEDNDLSYRIIARGGVIRFCPDALVAHYHQEDLERYLKEQFRHGFWRVKMYLDHPVMLTGDGYTFWKDALELPVSLGHFILWTYPPCWFFLFFGFVLFQMAFAFVMGFRGMDIFFAGLVMWARSFVRTAGFLTGSVVLVKRLFAGGKKT